MISKVYYNNQCSICRLEINHYKKNCNTIDWQDIDHLSGSETEINRTYKQLLRRLHVKNNNKIFVGVDAFIIIWSQIPRYKTLAKIIKIPIIYHLAFVTYEILALFLYFKNYSQKRKLN